MRDQGDKGHGDSQDRGRCHERRGKQVGDDSDQADGALEQDHDGAAHGLSCNRYGDGDAHSLETLWQEAGEPSTPRPGEEQQAKGGEGGQCEPEGPREPRVDAQEDKNSA